jgi:ankyrin repeat protein
LDARPRLAGKADKEGFLPLHLACDKGHLEITRMLLQLDPNCALGFNNSGYSPLHLAAMNGHVQILEEFVLSSPKSLSALTREGDTVFHLAVRFNRYSAFTYLAPIFYGTNLLRHPDKHGNTVLHLALSTWRFKVSSSTKNQYGKAIFHSPSYYSFFLKARGNVVVFLLFLLFAYAIKIGVN